MQKARPESCHNFLLSKLSAEDIGRLSPYLQLVELPRNAVVEQPGNDIEFCYFFESGLCSMVAVGEEDRQTEAAHIGWEGASGTSIVLGGRSAVSRAIMQVSGWGWQISADELIFQAERIPALRKALLLFAQSMTIQITHSLLAASRYRIAQRLARWLLMCHDRTTGNELSLTHEMLAMMLAVRRSSVTEELHILEGAKLIRAQRGSIVILDRHGLIDVAAGSYGIPEREYEILFRDFGSA